MTTLTTFYHSHPVLISIFAAIGFACIAGSLGLATTLFIASYTGCYDDNGAERDSKGP